MAEQLLGVERLLVEQAGRVADVEVVRRGRGCAQPFGHAGRRQGVRVAGLRRDAHATVLRDRARGPAGLDVAGEPLRGASVMQMIGIEQRDQHVDIEQGSRLARNRVFRDGLAGAWRAAHSSDWSRS